MVWDWLARAWERGLLLFLGRSWNGLVWSYEDLSYELAWTISAHGYALRGVRGCVFPLEYEHCRPVYFAKDIE